MHAIQTVAINKYTQERYSENQDLVVVEEPLEIRVVYGKPNARKQQSLSVTMRTPTKHDFELAIGFLFTENVINHPSDILSIKYCTDSGKEIQENIVKVELQPYISFKPKQLQRHFYTSSSCGLCGKTSIDSIAATCQILPKPTNIISEKFILSLSKEVQKQQVFHQHTGGFHAAGIFFQNTDNKIIREDIGRHNALDKAIGAAFMLHKIPLHNSVLFMSSRASFEIVQKAIRAGILTLVSVGSPSSLAVQTAQQFGLTLIGFLKEESFNIYTETSHIKQ